MSLPSFEIQHVQLIRKVVLGVALLLACGLAALSGGRAGGEDFNRMMEAAGAAMIVVCVVGRAWCSLYIGGRKKAEIVDRGPYSITRNPLYVFSFIGAFGVGAQTGSLVIAGLFATVAVAVFYVTVRREEDWLGSVFGAPYRAYMARTPRFWPAFSRWRDEETLVIRPRFFLLTLRDGLAFVMAVPLFAGLEYAQDSGWVSVLYRLP